MQRYFQISIHALIVTAFLALALTGRLDVPSMVLFTIGIGWSVFRTVRNLPPPLTPRGAFILSCIYIVLFFGDSAIVSRSFIPATIHLVLFLDLIKLYQEKTDKDYFYLIVLSFLMILAASSLTIDMSFVVTLVLFLIALVSTLMSFDMYRSGRKTGTPIRNISGPLGGMSVWATIWIIVIGVVLFFLIPRVGTQYFSRAATPSLLLSGFTDNVQLGQIGRVKLNTAVVMRAKLTSGTPEAVMRWRGISLDLFDGRGWQKTDRAHFPLAVRDDQYSIKPIDNSGRQIRYEILLEPLATTTLFGLHQVRRISGRLPGLDIDRDEDIYTRLPTLRRIQYEAVSQIPARSIDEGAVPFDIQNKYLQLPANTDPRIASLARDITGQAASNLEKASLVEAYLKRTYKYTLELTWDPGEQPISTFLFSAKSGHCEYFASSMAILLRTVGVPTRIVNGFLMGEYNPIGGDYIIRQSDAHSWVEVYVPGRGWLEFDPTPPDPRERSSGLIAQLSDYADAAELYWNTYILIYDSGIQLQLFRSAQDKAQTVQADLRSKADEWMIRAQGISDRIANQLQRLFDRTWFWILLGVAAASTAAFRNRKTIRTQIRILRLRGGSGSVNEDVVEAMFYRATRLAERQGKRRKPGETWREWIRSLPDPSRRSMLARSLEIFEKSKYGRMPVSASDFNLLEETVRELRA